MSFDLDPRLAGDSIFVLDLPLSAVRLINDRRFPWLLLVPRRPDIRELIELSRDDQIQLMTEIARASKVLQDQFAPDKLNIGALGNIVPQLHIHVIARQKTDAAWPGPVWGYGQPSPYPGSKGDQLAAKIAGLMRG